MYVVLLVVRFIHVVGGVFWVGGMIFVAFFLLPALREAGPDAGKVMAALARRRFMEIVPAIGTLTILSGLWLFWHDSASGADFMRSRMGMTLSTGAVLAIVALIIGGVMVRPAMIKAMALTQAAMTADSAQRGGMLADAMASRMRGASGARFATVLLILAATTMAIARYV
jgi:uncharacterized membrane protein